MNKLYTLLSLIFLLGVTASDAQTPTLKAYQKAAKKAIENKDFYSAWKYNSLALRIDSTKMSNMYNLGEAARLFKSYNVARDAYQTVLESDSKADFPLTEFWLARVYHSQSNYDKAITHYQKFVGEQVTPKGPSNGEGEEITQFTALAKQSILDAEWAREQIKQPKTGYLIAPFGNGVNTPATEFAPLEHQNQVYYSALEYDTENFCPDPNGEITRLYTSTDLNSGQPGAINWLKEEKGKFVAHTAFNGDGNRMYFTVCERVNATEFNCEIFYRNKDSNGLWGDASELPEYIN
ncbi:MAG: tetratricopeptide repeat protein, partial [Bacteroidota bacterium]